MPPQEPPPQPADARGAKLALRDQLVTARNRRPLAERLEVAQALASVLLETEEVRRAASVAAYVSIGSEPGTGPLRAALARLGRRVLLPVLLPDNDLDWVPYAGEDSLLPAGRGLLEPSGPRLGVEAIATCDAVLVPGLAVSRDGYRLGRGGGSYDRVLGRVPVGTFTCVLLHEDEVGVDVPVEPHDRQVTAAATPSGVVRLVRRPG